uniref:Uncharacterized protein n=1 Tax=Anguilla anguilla TaxID=7936 RepID=A0A0E9TQH9_ANGAN
MACQHSHCFQVKSFAQQKRKNDKLF